MPYAAANVIDGAVTAAKLSQAARSKGLNLPQSEAELGTTQFPWVSEFQDIALWTDALNCTRVYTYDRTIADRGYPLQKAITFSATDPASTDVRTRFTPAAAINMDHKHIYFKYFVHPGTVGGTDEWIGLEKILLFLFTNATSTRYAAIGVFRNTCFDLHPGMHELSLALDDPQDAVNAPDLTQVTRIEIRPTNIVNCNPKVTFLEIRVENPPAKGVVMFSFDNAYASSFGGWTKTHLDAANILKANGMYGTFNFSRKAVGLAGRLTEAELDQMYADGHTFTCYPMEISWLSPYWEMPLAQKIYNLRRVQKYFISKGWTRGVQCMGQPGAGYWSENDTRNLIGKYVQANIRMGGDYYGRLSVQGFSNATLIHRSATDNGTVAAATKLALCVSGKGMMNIFLHLDGATDTTTKAEFETLIAAVKAQVDAGTIEVLRAEKIVERYTL